MSDEDRRFRLEIESLGASETRVRIAEFFFAGEGHDFALHEREAATPLLVRSHQEGGRREVDRYAVEASGLCALDRLIFEIDSERFAEVGSYRSEDGPNLHLQPIVLPASLRLDVWNPVLEGARVRLAFAGRTRLRLGPAERVHRVICLVAADGEIEREQWLAEGVGEIALGPHNGPPEQWLVAWTGAGQTLFASPPRELFLGELPRLPKQDDRRPASSVF